MTRKIVTLKFLESLSTKYNYLTCNAQTYSLIRKIIKKPKDVMNVPYINTMKIVINRLAPKDVIFFFKANCGEIARSIDNVFIKPKKKKVKVILEQQCNMSINAKDIFAVCLKGQ